MKYDSSENYFEFLNLVIKERKMKFTLSQVSDKKKQKKQTEASDSLKELLHRLLLFVVQFPDFFVVLSLKQTKQCF